MTILKYTLDPDRADAPPMGLIVLQTDETVEPEFRRYFADHPSPIYVSRIPSGDAVTPETLGAMEAELSASAALLPKARPYPVVGYGCTSASALIGSARVEEMVQKSCDAAVVTNPLRATAAVAQRLGVSRFALISPYAETVNQPLRAAFARSGLSTDIFGTFNEPDEATVVRISTESIVDSACNLGGDESVEAVFLSCTNLRTYDAIPKIRERIGKPVLSSNSVLAQHMKWLATPDS